MEKIQYKELVTTLIIKMASMRDYVVKGDIINADKEYNNVIDWLYDTYNISKR